MSINESDLAATSATALIEQSSKSYRTAGAPSDANVYHLRIPALGHAYYFSPEASEVAKDVLNKFRGVALSDEPNLRDLDPITLQFGDLTIGPKAMECWVCGEKADTDLNYG